MRPTATERWRDIPGFDGVYQASTEGRIRRYWPKSGRYTLLHPYTKKMRKPANNKALRVKMKEPSGRWVERPVLKLVAETFFNVPDGMVAVHTDGCREDNSVANITFMPSKQLGVKYGVQACRRPVVKISPDGEVLEAYKSAREAARQNYMSYQTVLDRCNRKRKREFSFGFSFRWDDQRNGRYYE